MAWAIVNQAQTEEDRRWGTDYWHKTCGFSTFDLTRFTEEDKATTTLPANGAWVELPTIHAFSDTGDAYDACQCDAKIETGDTLVIEDESVVGLAYAWPIAVTVATGKLHQLKPGHEIMDTIDGITEVQVRQAVKEATTRGLTIAPEFERFKA